MYFKIFIYHLTVKPLTDRLKVGLKQNLICRHSFQSATFCAVNTFIDYTLTMLIYYLYQIWLMYSSWWILNYQMVLLPVGNLCTAVFVQLFEYFIAFYVITYKMSRKWESDKKLTSHKLNSFEAKLGIIIVLQAMDLKIHCVHC